MSKTPVKMSPSTNQHPTFYALPVAFLLLIFFICFSLLFFAFLVTVSDKCDGLIDGITLPCITLITVFTVRAGNVNHNELDN